MVYSLSLTERVCLSLLPNLRHAPLEDDPCKEDPYQRIMMNVALCDIWYI